MVQNVPSGFSGLEHLATAVMLLNPSNQVVYANPSTETLFALSATQIAGSHISEVFLNCEILQLAIENAVKNDSPYREHEFAITTVRQQSFAVTCTVTPVEMSEATMLLEFQQMDQQLRIAREERMLIQQQANSELLRN